MKKVVIFILIMLFVNSCSVFKNQETGGTSSDNIHILDSGFGIFWTDTDGELQFMKADVIPFYVGQEYGWMITYEPKLARSVWREELILPEPPMVWGGAVGDPSIHISSDGRVFVRKFETSGDEGEVYGTFEIAEGDPVGKYIINVYLGEKQIKTFEFFIKDKTSDSDEKGPENE